MILSFAQFNIQKCLVKLFIMLKFLQLVTTAVIRVSLDVSEYLNISVSTSYHVTCFREASTGESEVAVSIYL